MSPIEKLVKLFLNFYPIKSKSPYKFAPLFFILGGCMEWVMIKIPAAGSGETFYDVWRRKQAERNFLAQDKKTSQKLEEQLNKEL